MLRLTSLVVLCSAFSAAHAVTVYGQIPLAQTVSATATATDSSAATATTLAAYDKTELTPPALPSPNPGANAYTLSLEKSAASVQGLSIPHVGGGFWGFSIEMSGVSQGCKYPSFALYCSMLTGMTISGQKLVRCTIFCRVPATVS